MRLLVAAALSVCSIASIFSQTNVGVGTTAPTNRLHVINTADPLRLEGVSSGATTDSLLTINSTGVVKRRTVASVLSTGGGWLLTGNTGSAAAFLGTTNTAGLNFRTNNQKAGFLDYDSSKRNNAFGNRAQNALTASTTGTANNAFGYQAMYSLTTGTNNIAVGDSAAYSLVNGVDNITIGTDAGIALVSGFQNIAIGSRSLPTAAAASDNIAIGHRTLENSISSSNIAIGSLALNGNNFGSDNIGIGNNALGRNAGTGTSINIAIGNNALSNTTTSVEQVAIGYNAGLGLTSGSYNTVIGHYALGTAFTAASSYNTVLGYQAGANQTSGNSNTYIGWTAGPTVAVNPSTGVGATGSGNTYVGYATTSNGNYSNSSAFGNGAVATANNMVRIGNTSVTVIGGNANWSNLSDERVKTNVQEDVKGLSFISLLHPVTYNYNLQKADDLQKVPQAARTSYAEKQAIRYSGFLAQEVEVAAQKAGYNFSGVNKPQNNQSLYSISYAELVVPLVKAVQELKQIVEQQQAEIEALKKRTVNNE